LELKLILADLREGFYECTGAQHAKAHLDHHPAWADRENNTIGSGPQPAPALQLGSACGAD
jgi:hypothetical protein